MADLQELEQKFWLKVWRCTHRHPCKKCCWPWRGADLGANWKDTWTQHFSTPSADGAVKRTKSVHRLAYELTHGPISFYGHGFHFCHQCHFAPCCNPVHICPGAPSDNRRDARVVMQNGRKPILLPDGRIWTYQAALDNTKYFYEAVEFRRVWAGAVPKDYQKKFLGLQPEQPYWPGTWPEKKVVIRKEMKVDDLQSIRESMNCLARTYGISLEFLCYLAVSKGGDHENYWHAS